MKTIKEMFDAVMQTWEEHKERKEREFATEKNYMAKEYACYDDLDGHPFLSISGVPVFAITGKKTDLTKSSISIGDARTIINNMRQSYIDKEYSK